jgi:hypothetical protein
MVVCTRLSVGEEVGEERIRLETASYWVNNSRRRFLTFWASSSWAFVGIVSLSLRKVRKLLQTGGGDT